MRNRAGLGFAAGLVMGACALAQQGPDSDPDAAQGYANNIFHHSSVDSINTFNGQLTIPIALGPSYPIGPKLKFQTMLVYTSRVFEFGNPDVNHVDPTTLITPFVGNPALGVGWSFNVGAIKACGIAQNSVCYISPDGAEHLFDQLLSGGYFKTGEGSQFVLHLIDLVQGYEMWDGDGNHYKFAWKVGGGTSGVGGYDDGHSNYIYDFGRGRDGWYLTRLEDPFLNAMTVSYYGSLGTLPCWTYPSGAGGYQMLCPALGTSWIPASIQTPSATISISLDPATNRISSFSFPVLRNGSASSAVWSLGYQTQVVNRTGGSNPSGINAVFLTSIALPSDAGAQYQFAYNYGAGVYHGSYGGVAQSMTLPTGATASYFWGTYSFYHSRRSTLGVNCTPMPPPAGSPTLVSGRLPPGFGPSTPKGPVGTASIGSDCGTFNPNRWRNDEYGVIRRKETGPGIPTAVTDYIQYSFPFGERGTSPTNDYGRQTLTVTVFSPGIEGRSHAVATLFLGTATSDGSSVPGDQNGAEIRTAVYDHDPDPGIYASFPQPLCGGTADSLCVTHGVRVTQRTFDYPRRVQKEVVYYQATGIDGSCFGCPNHQTEFLPQEANAPGAWESRGRHFATEQHSGILGSDSRTITTTWTPVNWALPSNGIILPNIFSERTESDSTLLVDRFFYFDPTNGFLKGVENWDSAAQRLLIDCRYKDSAGNVQYQLTATVSSAPGPCFPNFTDWQPVFGQNNDAFAKFNTYQNGRLTTSRWINGGNPVGWFAVDRTRDAATGWITSSRDTAGQTTSYLYDGVGRVTSVTPPGEAAVIVSYPSPTQTIATRNGGVGLSTYQEYSYDSLGRLVRERRLMPVGRYAKRFTQYDSAGNDFFNSEWVTDATSETVTADLATTCSYANGALSAARPSAAPGTYRLCYDPFGRPQEVVGANHSSRVTVNRADTGFSPSIPYSDTLEAATTACVNGVFGAGGCQVPGADSTTTRRKDAFGRLTAVTEPGGDVTSYSYDVNDRLRSVSQGGGGQTRTFTYGPFGFLRSEVTPEKGTLTNTALTSRGDVVSQTQPDGVVINRTYDFAGRVTLVTSSEGGSRTYVQNTYNDATPGTSFGKLTSRTAWNYAVAGTPSVTDTFTYGGVGGRESQQRTQVAGAYSLDQTQTWFYNALGLLAHYYHPQSPTAAARLVISTVYDAGLPITEYVNGIPAVTNVTYQSSGALSGYTTGFFSTPTAGMRNIVTTIAGDSSLLPRPSRIYASDAYSGSRPFDTQAYAYDGVGNIVSMGGTANDSFAYDLRSRLTSATLNGAGSQAYTYDTYGNLFSKAGVTFCTPACTNNRVTAGASYDGRGNLIGYGPNTYTYDGLDRMTSNQGSTLWSYLYDAAGERVVRIPPALAWNFSLRDQADRLATEFAGALPIRDNIYLGNNLVAAYSDGSQDKVWTFYSSDHLGTPRLVSDVTGSFVLSPRYWPFGEVVAGVSPQRLRFAAMEQDTESGPNADRYHDHARSHAANLGRFLSPDKLEGKIFDPQSWNRYAYARNNPVRLLDPNGLDFTVAAAFANSNLTLRQQVKVARQVGATFAQAGVKNVTITLNGVPVFKSPFDARAHELGRDQKSTLNVAGTNPEIDSKRRGEAPILAPGQANVSLATAPAEGPGRETFAVNVSTHELGHTAGLRPTDTGAAPGTAMEVPNSAADISHQVRLFSPEDASAVSSSLNGYVPEPPPPNPCAQNPSIPGCSGLEQRPN